MSGHEEIRDLLTLAAAGALDAAGQRRVEDHLRECRDCRAELEGWQQLTGALKQMPTPQAPMGLVERTRRRMERQAAARVEQQRRRVLLMWLTAFAWASTLLPGRCCVGLAAGWGNGWVLNGPASVSPKPLSLTWWCRG
jgi:anti-sigma factor RsiW